MKTTALLTSLLFSLFGLTFDLTPNVPLLFISVCVGMLIDLGTGVAKAIYKKKERTSEGLRRTVKKVIQYFSAIGLSHGVQYLIKVSVKNAEGEGFENLQYISMFVYVFIIYIEITSILENVWEIDQRSMLAKFFIKPLLTILKFGLTKNPLVSAEDKITNQPVSTDQK